MSERTDEVVIENEYRERELTGDPLMTDAFRILAVWWLAGIFFAATAEPALAADELPQTTPEGMELLKQTRSRVTYAMPGATLEQYKRVALLDCYVAFAKNWERDYNRQVSPNRRISAKDMEKIKARLAEEFNKVFTKELTEAGHEVVDHTGEDVLVVRPAIINLDVTAPDVGSAGLTHVIVRSAGQMTLYMELFDSTTGAIIARVIDAKASDRAFAFEATRTTNKAEADRILREWARELAGHIGAVREETAEGVKD
jgi:hypothetical protein